MGKIWMPGGGGGADLDVITAGSGDVLAGKVIVDKEGNPLPGTMPDRGAVKPTLNAGGSYTIPAGYHNGGGKVTANSLASQTPGNVDAGSMLSGRSGWANGAKVNGGIPWQNATVSGTDRVWATNMSNWAGTINLGVRNGHYLNGVNWIQQDIPNFQPGNIKKGVNIGGVVGTFEGWVPTATDLYLYGNNIKGFTEISAPSVFDAGQISVRANGSQHIKATFSTVGYTHLNIKGHTSNSSEKKWELSYTSGSMRYTIASLNTTLSGDYTISLNVTNQQMQKYFMIGFTYAYGAIYRIWLS